MVAGNEVGSQIRGDEDGIAAGECTTDFKGNFEMTGYGLLSSFW